MASGTPYEVIDTDPYFGRVIRYMRPSDWFTWIASTAAAPAIYAGWEYLDPINYRIHNHKLAPLSSRPSLRLATSIGFFGGFYIAYARSSTRFWGWSENQREVAKDRYEIKSRLATGKSPYGDSTLRTDILDAAARNSTYSQTRLSVLPWFNLVHHPYHGVNINKYYDVRPGEEKWGFDLKKPADL